MNPSFRRLGILVLGAALVWTGPAQAGLRSLLSRETVQAIVVDEATRADFPPELALAVAEVESAFSTHAVSHAGARGVMQIMPRTGRDLFGLEPWELYDARTNIRAGIAYLDELIDTYGRLDIALSHYNGGSAVRRRDGSLRVIPATRSYVDRVLARERHWRGQPLVRAAYERRAEPARAVPVRRRSAERRSDVPDPAPAQTGRDTLHLLDQARAETVRALRSLARRNADRAAGVAPDQVSVPAASRNREPRSAASRRVPALDDFDPSDPARTALRIAEVRAWEAFR